MAAIQQTNREAPVAASELHGGPWLSTWWVIGGAALLLLLILGWGLILHPTWTAPTRDPAWYTWRSNVILQADPGSIAREWGPGSVFSGGYRVTVPLAGALLQRVAGISQYSFSAFLMVGIPVLAGMALGVGAFRERKDALAMLLTMLASAALFLTTPYVGYLDNITVLFLLSLIVGFATAVRTSWGARTAVFLIATAVAFTHPTTAVLFGVTLMAVFGFHFLSSHLSLGAALKADGPLLMSTGFGMIFGLSFWVVGIWGPTAKFADAALPPPYTKQFFLERLTGWITSLQPLITGPLILIAVLSSILWSRRSRRPVGEYTVVSAWWFFPFLGLLTAFTGTAYQHAGDPGSSVVPYYRFMNATAAPIALVGLGAFVAVRYFLRWGRRGASPGSRDSGGRRIVAVIAAVAVIASLGWVLLDGLNHRWVSEQAQWIDEPARTSLAAVNVVAEAAGARPNILVMNYNDQDDDTQSNTAYGWAKTFTNVFRTGLPGTSAGYAATYMGTVDNFLSGQPTTSGSAGYTTWARKYFNDTQARRREFPEPPVAFLVGQFYKGSGDLDAATQGAIEVGPDVWVLQGEGLWTPPADVVQRAQAAAAAKQASFDDHPGPLGDPLHTLRVLFGLLLLAVLPGLLAAPFFELDDVPSKMAMIPGLSIVMSLLAGIAVLAVWRGPLTSAKGWTVVAVAVGLGALLRLVRVPITGVLLSFGSFFNKLFSVFSNRDFAVLMGVQFMAQAGQGVIQGAIGKSIAFGGEKGFDVSTVPSADYLLKVVLALYVPYTLISPFIGVFIDRFARRKVVAWTNVLVAAVVTAVAVLVMLPLGKATSEGNVGATVGLIVALLAAQACVRVVLAVKSAAIPDVLVGKDLLQGNGLSQAGGALFQVFGIAFALGAGAVVPAWLVVVGGAAVLLISVFIARQMRHAEAHPHDTTFAQEASRVVHNVIAGIKEVAERQPAALGLTSFQMLRYQFWGFGLFTFALYAKNLVQGGNASNLALAVSGGGGMVGGAIGLILAQKLKDRVPPIRLLLVSMVLLGAGTLVFGSFVSLPGFAAMLFVGFFAFFVGKISADTIMQQSMPDDFRGRAFALFDIAYNLGFIVPAFILSFIWIENDPTRTRWILIISGAVFLGLTALVAAWARRIHDQFAPQDDLVEIEGDPVVPASGA
jgi:Major Facilitator Superfamily